MHKEPLAHIIEGMKVAQTPEYEAWIAEVAAPARETIEQKVQRFTALSPEEFRRPGVLGRHCMAVPHEYTGDQVLYILYPQVHNLGIVFGTHGNQLVLVGHVNEKTPITSSIVPNVEIFRRYKIRHPLSEQTMAETSVATTTDASSTRPPTQRVRLSGRWVEGYPVKGDSVTR